MERKLVRSVTLAFRANDETANDLNTIMHFMKSGQSDAIRSSIKLIAKSISEATLVGSDNDKGGENAEK